MKGSHSACDWLLQQLNQRFLKNADTQNSTENSNVDIIERKALEWNKSSKKNN